MKKTVITVIVNTQNNYMSLCVCVLNEQKKKAKSCIDHNAHFQVNDGYLSDILQGC